MPKLEEWVRTSMRTPGIFIFGMVFAPCGWILNLTSTVAPNWRTLRDLPGVSTDQILQQGIWDICQAFESSRVVQCNQPDTDYFNNPIIPIAQGLMVASLIVTLIGLAVAIPGIRCWTDRPNWTVAGIGGVLIFLSGVMTLIPISWYTHILKDINAPPNSVIRVDFCIILGYIGGIFEVVAGFVMFIGICRCCGGKNRGEKRVVIPEFRHTRSPPRRVAVPSVIRTTSSASSVPYSKNSMDEEVDFPRAFPRTGPRSGALSANSYASKPYDADL
ncbi:claudin-23-like [Hypomesus transpacificus]|uniref:claudin-23-like n=1 Tax=Hypomesus transpacificus TaxID=137520 RepID=UPI001F08702E|nr:claudin-23-like [Hypomesus transpacificus]